MYTHAVWMRRMQEFLGITGILQSVREALPLKSVDSV